MLRPLSTHKSSHTKLDVRITTPDLIPQPANALCKVDCWNTLLTKLAYPKPLRIVHLAYNIVAENHQAQIDFYLTRLHFKATDAILNTGTFMQCEGDVEHHIFFLCFRPNKAGINYFALELRNFDEVIAAGNHMSKTTGKNPAPCGRHLLGSNIYRFYHPPPADGWNSFARWTAWIKISEPAYGPKTPASVIVNPPTGLVCELLPPLLPSSWRAKRGHPSLFKLRK